MDPNGGHGRRLPSKIGLNHPAGPRPELAAQPATPHAARPEGWPLSSKVRPITGVTPSAYLGQSRLDQVRRGFAGSGVPGERRRVDRVLRIQSRPQGTELALACRTGQHHQPAASGTPATVPPRPAAAATGSSTCRTRRCAPNSAQRRRPCRGRPGAVRRATGQIPSRSPGEYLPSAPDTRPG